MLPSKEPMLALRLDVTSVGEFYITLDKPHKTWMPGEEVLGQIILVSNKNLVNAVVTLSLIGVIKINLALHKLRPLKQQLCNHTIQIYGGSPDDETGLFKGEHRFPFIVKLPVKRIFTLIEFGKGSITYILRAAIGNAAPPVPLAPLKVAIANPTYALDKVLNLLLPIDVLQLPPAKPKRLIIRDPSQLALLMALMVLLELELVSDLLRPQTIRVLLEVPQRGYIRGETIPLTILIRHLRLLQDLNGIIVTFVRVCRLDNATEGFLELFRKDLHQVVLPLYVDPGSFQAEVSSNIRIPADVFPTIVGCPLVLFQYFIEVLINLSGKLAEITQPYVNTDKFKRSKRFLQLTQEVVIGTHRTLATPPTTPSERATAATAAAAAALAGPISTAPPSAPSVPLAPSVASPSTNPSLPAASPQAAAPPGTPPPPPPAVPAYQTTATDEKQRLRDQEAALMPLAPEDPHPVLMEESDEDHVVSPINDELLEEQQQPYNFFQEEEFTLLPPYSGTGTI